MIEQTSLNNSPLKFIRLKTGDDLIAEISMLETGYAKSVFKLTNPMKVIYMINNKEGIHIALVNWIFSKVSPAEEFYIDPSDVLVLSSVNPELEEYYVKVLQAEHKEKEEESEEESIDKSLEGEEFKDEDVAYIKQIMQDIKDGRRKTN